MLKRMFKMTRYKFAAWRSRVWFRDMTAAWDRGDYDYYNVARNHTNEWARRALRYAP